jgi:hypothetical protein
MTNTTFEAIKPLRFGYGFLGQHRTMKLRFKREHAEHILERLPKHFHRSILLFTTQKGMTFIACIEHQQSAIWPALEEAMRLAKADSLRIKADRIEFQMPEQIELPF